VRLGYIQAEGSSGSFVLADIHAPGQWLDGRLQGLVVAVSGDTLTSLMRYFSRRAVVGLLALDLLWGLVLPCDVWAK